MANLQRINIGTTANDGTGDPLRDAMDKINQNSTTLEESYVQGVQGGLNISIDNSDPTSPIINGNGAIGVTAGRSYLTADIDSGSGLYISQPVPSDSGNTVTQTINADDNEVVFWPIDFLGEIDPNEPRIFRSGNYDMLITVATNSNSGERRYRAEFYLANEATGVVIDPQNGRPIGDLGVSTVADFDSGILDINSNNETQVTLVSNVQDPIVLTENTAIRIHISVEKVGTQGGIVVESLRHGTDSINYINYPLPISTNSVRDDSDSGNLILTDTINQLLSGSGGGPTTVQDIATASLGIGVELHLKGYYEESDGYEHKGVVVADIGQIVDGGAYHQLANGNLVEIYLTGVESFKPITWGVGIQSNTNGDSGARLQAMADYLWSRSDLAIGYTVDFQRINYLIENEVIWRCQNDQMISFNGNGCQLEAPDRDRNILTINGDLLPENWWKFHPTEAAVGVDLLADLQAADADPATRIDAIHTLLNNRGTDAGDRAYTEPSAFSDAQVPFARPIINNMKFYRGRHGLTVVSSYAGQTNGCKYRGAREAGERLIFCLAFQSGGNMAAECINESFLARDGGLTYRYLDANDTATIVQPRVFSGFSQCNSSTYINCRVANSFLAKSAFKDYGNSSIKYLNCISEGSEVLCHFQSIGVTTTGYGVSFESIHVESKSVHSFHIDGKRTARISGLYQQLAGNILYSGGDTRMTATEISSVSFFVGKFEVTGSPIATAINASINPPSNPNSGDLYIVWDGVNGSTGFSATGAWAGNENKLAEWNGSSWDFSTPNRYDGWNQYDRNSGGGARFDPVTATWINEGLSRGGGLWYVSEGEANHLEEGEIWTDTLWQGGFVPTNAGYVGGAPNASTMAASDVLRLRSNYEVVEYAQNFIWRRVINNAVMVQWEYNTHRSKTYDHIWESRDGGEKFKSDRNGNLSQGLGDMQTFINQNHEFFHHALKNVAFIGTDASGKEIEVSAQSISQAPDVFSGAVNLAKLNSILAYVKELKDALIALKLIEES